jgi:hypothetical protein
MYDYVLKAKGATPQKVTVPFERPTTTNIASGNYIWSKENRTVDDTVWIPTLNECSAEPITTEIWVRDIPSDFTDTSKQNGGYGFYNYAAAANYDELNYACTRSTNNQTLKLSVNRTAFVKFMFAL